ncbi:MAG: TetR/AcrR family transcriptional regulator [Bacteroidota bacterium]
MGVTERKERERAQRQAAILAAAEKIFGEKGYDASTMNDVAEAAELAKGTLYLYYQNKEDLCCALNAKGMDIMMKMFRKAIVKPPKGIDKIRAIGEAFFEFARRYPLYAKLLMDYAVKNSDDENCTPYEKNCVELGLSTIGFFVEVIRGGIEDGSVSKKTDPLKTAFLLWSSSHGLALLLSTKGVMMEQQLGIKKKIFLDYYFDFMETAMKK